MLVNAQLLRAAKRLAAPAAMHIAEAVVTVVKRASVREAVAHDVAVGAAGATHVARDNARPPPPHDTHIPLGRVALRAPQDVREHEQVLAVAAVDVDVRQAGHDSEIGNAGAQIGRAHV